MDFPRRRASALLLVLASFAVAFGCSKKPEKAESEKNRVFPAPTVDPAGLKPEPGKPTEQPAKPAPEDEVAPQEAAKPLKLDDLTATEQARAVSCPKPFADVPAEGAQELKSLFDGKDGNWILRGAVHDVVSEKIADQSKVRAQSQLELNESGPLLKIACHDSEKGRPVLVFALELPVALSRKDGTHAQMVQALAQVDGLLVKAGARVSDVPERRFEAGAEADPDAGPRVRVLRDGERRVKVRLDWSSTDDGHHLSHEVEAIYELDVETAR